MKNNFEQCLAFVLKEEGGYVNDAHDPGGATNFGVTKATYEQFIGHPVSIQDMQSLTVEQITPLYRGMFWDAVHGDDLPAGLRRQREERRPDPADLHHRPRSAEAAG